MSRSSRSIQVAPEHRQQVKMALRRHGFPSQNALAQDLGISRATTSQFFLGRRVDFSYFVEISNRLGLDWEAITYIQEDSTIKVEPAPPPDQPPKGKPDNEKLEIDWRQVCRDMLQAQNQRRLTTNPLTAGDGVAFELDEIYVPLGLVERRQRSRLVGDVYPEQGSRIYKSEAQDEIVQTFQHDEFFEQVLRQGRSRRIAIIGEPGAGKTTLLQKIAAWVLDNTEDTPIWISLADLQGKSIERYLLSNWLKAATRKVRVTDAMQEALGELFNNKQVWLLLDGVDEMVMGTQSHTSLQWIANQITGWVADARVVLTCRLNLWDVGKNALEAFETYRNLDFSYGDAQTPDQVEQFIKHWFQGNPQLAERLRSELNQFGKERIKDAVKNPLRLALLCRSWALGQGRLPNTKAGLYQQFTEAIYEWKQDRFPTSSNQRQELNSTLGELALRAISEEKTKFRLHHRLVCSVLGESDTTLFKLALQLGWLNQVGIAAEAENRGKNVYAFYHSTFQEYFAALAIDDWHYFLNHSPDNPEQGIYRVFESQWKEVILLWLGREDIAKEQKEEFIKALVEFEDGCKDFYKYRAYFLAAAGISEFWDCGRASGIVEQIAKWSFGYFNVNKQEWRTFIEPIEEGARATLTEMQGHRMIAALVQLISSTQDESIRSQVAFILGKINPGNQDAIRVLVQLISSTQDESICSLAVFRLGKIGFNSSEAIAALIQVISSTQNEDTRRMAFFSLGKIGKNNPEAIVPLVQLISSIEDKGAVCQAAENLRRIDPGNPEVILALVQLIESTDNEYIRKQAVENLIRIDPGKPEVILALVQLIESTEDWFIRKQTIESLGKIGTSNPIAIAALVQLIESTDNEYIRRKAVESLGKIGIGNPIAIAILVQLIESTDNEYIRKQAVESLGKIGIGNPIAIAILVQLIESTDNEYIRKQAVESLGKIGASNLEAIAILVQLIQSTKDGSIRKQAVESLGKIGTGNPEAIAILVQLIQSTDNGSIRKEAVESLGEIGIGNPIAIATLVQLIESTKDWFIRKQAVESLGKIGTDNLEAIAILVQLIESTEDGYIRKQAVESLGKIGTGNPEAIAILVQLIQSTENEHTRLQGDKIIRRQAAYNLKKILRDEQLAGVITNLKNHLSDEIYKNDTEQFEEYYKLIWYCGQIMPYPDFYQAWHNQPTLL
jgi:HEAT repeat protein/type II secretory pathway predicted ATPase ExeA